MFDWIKNTPKWWAEKELQHSSNLSSAWKKIHNNNQNIFILPNELTITILNSSSQQNRFIYIVHEYSIRN